jgi:ankyrin repeat protein|eukprot:COSAG01_NODE_5419_length_4274_cov_5.445509_5_plen_81_part_00
MDTTRLLVEHGASLSVTEHHGNTPLHVAASHHMAEAVSYLLSKGADPERTNSAKQRPHDLAYGEAKSVLERHRTAAAAEL